MAACGSCAVPSCASTPFVGFRPGGLGGLSYGSLGRFSYGGRGFGAGGMGGSAVSASILGVLDGVIPSCINQLPSSEVVIQPPSCILTLPGCIISASCEPVAVGGNTPCALGGYGRGLLGSSSYGVGRCYGYTGSKGGICY